jgi:sarcosine oxidase
MYENYVAPYLPALGSKCIKAVACLYTVTPDAGFVIDVHPESDRIIIASPCSGHGFKHSAAIGEALAELATERRSRFDLSAFRLGRFD